MSDAIPQQPLGSKKVVVTIPEGVCLWQYSVARPLGDAGWRNLAEDCPEGETCSPPDFPGYDGQVVTTPCYSQG